MEARRLIIASDPLASSQVIKSCCSVRSTDSMIFQGIGTLAANKVREGRADETEGDGWEGPLRREVEIEVPEGRRPLEERIHRVGRCASCPALEVWHGRDDCLKARPNDSFQLRAEDGADIGAGDEGRKKREVRVRRWAASCSVVSSPTSIMRTRVRRARSGLAIAMLRNRLVRQSWKRSTLLQSDC